MFKTIMHVSFFTDRMEEMLEFYTKKLGLELKVVVRYKSYLGREDRPAYQEIAKTEPEKIFNAYIEIAPGQFIELFPKNHGQVERNVPWNSELGYSHFGLICEDIYKTREELEARGIVFDTGISKGPSETYQMWTHDPDGNMFEIMQYTDKSFQVVGHID